MFCWINLWNLFPQCWDFRGLSQSLPLSHWSDSLCCLEQYALIHYNPPCFLLFKPYLLNFLSSSPTFLSFDPSSCLHSSSDSLLQLPITHWGCKTAKLDIHDIEALALYYFLSCLKVIYFKHCFANLSRYLAETQNSRTHFISQKWVYFGPDLSRQLDVTWFALSPPSSTKRSVSTSLRGPY